MEATNPQAFRGHQDPNLEEWKVWLVQASGRRSDAFPRSQRIKEFSWQTGRKKEGRKHSCKRNAISKEKEVEKVT